MGLHQVATRRQTTRQAESFLDDDSFRRAHADNCINVIRAFLASNSHLISSNFNTSPITLLDKDASAIIKTLKSYMKKKSNTKCNNIVTLMPDDKYHILNHKLSSYIIRMNINGTTKGYLVDFCYHLDTLGVGLIGDVVIMTREELLLHACSAPFTKAPISLLCHLEKALQRIGLSINMAAPRWSRLAAPSIAEQIADRDRKQHSMPSRSSPNRKHPLLRLIFTQ